MSTATETRIDGMNRSERREMAARQFAMQITSLIRDYLGRNVITDVEAILAKAAYDNNFELTTLTMREEYEAHRRLLLSVDNLSPTGQFSPQKEATPHG